MSFPDRIERVAQQFLAALARDWDGPLDALKGPPRPDCWRVRHTPISRNRRTAWTRQ